MTISNLKRRQDYKTIRQVLMKEWDPIGVCDEPYAQGEYDNYIPQVYGMLLKGLSINDVSVYLRTVEVSSMGLPGNVARTREVAQKLMDLKLTDKSV